MEINSIRFYSMHRLFTCLFLANSIGWFGQSFVLAQAFKRDKNKNQVIQCSTIDQKIPLPTDNSYSGEVRFAAIGDSGTGDKNQIRLGFRMSTIQKITKFNLLLFLGDNIYPTGDPDKLNAVFNVPYSELYRENVQMKVVIGNHDIRNKKGVVKQQEVFRMGSDSYYSFTWGDKLLNGNPLIEFFALDSNLFVRNKKRKYTIKTGEIQKEWLIQQLAKSKAKWKIIFMHHPVYSSDKSHGVKVVNATGIEKKVPDEMKQMRAIESIFKQYNVNLVLTGHSHVYEHIKPQITSNNSKIHYFVSGTGSKVRTKDFNHKMPDFHVCGNNFELSFMLFSVDKNAIKFWAINEKGNSFDSGLIQ